MSLLARWRRWRRYRRILAAMMDKQAGGGYRRVSPRVYEEMQKAARAAAGRPGEWTGIAAMLAKRRRSP